MLSCLFAGVTIVLFTFGVGDNMAFIFTFEEYECRSSMCKTMPPYYE